MEEELNNLLSSIDEKPLTPEEKEILKKEAIEQFNQIEGVEFKDFVDDDTKNNIKNDFLTTRKVLTKNIDRIEKLTNLLITNVAQQPENGLMLQNLISVISEQNKQIKMIHEIHNKMIMNISAEKKNNPDKKDDIPSSLKYK